MLKVKTLVVGPLATNCYLVTEPEARQGIIIDPGAEKEKILSAVSRNGAKFIAVINTHCHFDHIGADILKEELGLSLFVHQLDLPFLKSALSDQTALLGFGPAEEAIPQPDKFLKEGDEIKIGKESLLVWHTPGHTPGGICLVGQDLVFTGDTLFKEGVGRTDLEGGSDDELEKSLKRLFTLPDEFIVYPGHGPATLIGDEKPFINKR